MGDTDGPTRQPSLTAECSVMTALRQTYYRPLVRLAALLIGNADAAEEVVCDTLAALPARPVRRTEQSESLLRYLQQQVLIRCRHRRAPHLPAPRQPQARQNTECSAASAQVPGQSAAPDFAGLPVVRALQDLRAREREAIVLMHYLDLTLPQAAVVAGVPGAVLRHRLSQAMRMLENRLPSA